MVALKLFGCFFYCSCFKMSNWHDVEKRKKKRKWKEKRRRGEEEEGGGGGKGGKEGKLFFPLKNPHKREWAFKLKALFILISWSFSPTFWLSLYNAEQSVYNNFTLMPEKRISLHPANNIWDISDKTLGQDFWISFQESLLNFLSIDFPLASGLPRQNISHYVVVTDNFQISNLLLWFSLSLHFYMSAFIWHGFIPHYVLLLTVGGQLI